MNSFDFITATSTSDSDCMWVYDCVSVRVRERQTKREDKRENQRMNMRKNLGLDFQRVGEQERLRS